MLVKIDLQKGGNKMEEETFEDLKINMNLRIEENLKNQFKIATIKNNTTMTDAIMNFIREYIQETEQTVN